MADILDNIFTRPFAEDDALLNDFVNEIVHRVSWKAFEHQENIVHMAYEMENGVPKMKDDGERYLRNLIQFELGHLVEYIYIKMLIQYRLGNLDLNDGAQWDLNEEFGEDAPELEAAIRKAVYADYAKYLGVDEANAYFKRIGREDWIDADFA